MDEETLCMQFESADSVDQRLFVDSCTAKL